MNSTEILLGISIIGIIVLAYLSLNTLSSIVLAERGAVQSYPIRMTPEQYFSPL